MAGRSFMMSPFLLCCRYLVKPPYHGNARKSTNKFGFYGNRFVPAFGQKITNLEREDKSA